MLFLFKIIKIVERKEENEEILNILINLWRNINNIDITETTENNDEKFIATIKANNILKVEKLIKKDSTLASKENEFERPFRNIFIYTNTGLLLALKLKNFKIAELLIEHGASIKKTSIKQCFFPSVLSIACLTDNIEMAKFLIKKGADVNEPDYPDSLNLSLKPLDHAIEKKNVEIIILLLECDADVFKDKYKHKLTRAAIFCDPMEESTHQIIGLLITYWNKQNNIDKEHLNNFFKFNFKTYAELQENY